VKARVKTETMTEMRIEIVMRAEVRIMEKEVPSIYLVEINK
jgi:hypothetical protein